MIARSTYYHCGICDHMHNALWDGDCREDAARFFADELDEKHGPVGWDEIDMEHVDDWRENSVEMAAGRIEPRP